MAAGANAYVGSMFDFLQAQVNERHIDTIEQVVELNYTIYAAPAPYDILYFSKPQVRQQ